MRVTEPYTIFPRTLASGKIVYYYQFRNKNGLRSGARSTGCTTKSAAKRYCQKLYNEGAFLSIEKGITFNTFAKDFFGEENEYRKWKRANGRDLKTETVRRYTLALESHLLPFFGNIPLNEITSDYCKKWVIWASERLSPKSVNTAQGVLNLILEWALDKDIIGKNPLRHIGTRKIVKKNRDLLTVAEIKKVYMTEWPSENERTAFLLTCITGMRIGEVCGLKTECLKENAVEVVRTMSDKCGLQESTKTGMCRFVPVPKGFPFNPGKDFVFESEQGKPLKPHSVYNAFVRRLDALEIDRKARGITIHTMRDFFVSFLRSKNISDAKIRAVVGHADRTMTDLYTYWKPEMFPEVYEAQKELFEKIMEE